MSRPSSNRAFARISVIILLAVSNTLAQTPKADNTAEAKLHYQNAVAAISKKDWQTAKAELLQAEKLAPQNALMHYDLALAYSHTGAPKSAQAELNKALQLGLPAEQQRAAEQLKQTLAGQEVSAKKNGDKVAGPRMGTTTESAKAPSAPPDEPASPSIEETLAYLNERVDSGFIPSTRIFVPGIFTISSAKTLQWSRWREAMDVLREGQWQDVSSKSGQCVEGIIGYSGAKPTDLDVESVIFNRETGEIHMDCKSYACWDFFGGCSRGSDVARRIMVAYKVPHNKFFADQGIKGVVIQTNGNPEVGENFTRALRHLIRLMQALPENKADPQKKDPFAN
jgi:tetratricopeptide (TPR) repeat protein